MTRSVSIPKLISLLALGVLVAMTVLVAEVAAETLAAETDEIPGDATPADSFFARLAADLDADGDGVITREEFDQGTSRFPRLDRNEDGLLTEEDFADMPDFGRFGRGGFGMRGPGGPGMGGPDMKGFGHRGPGMRGPGGPMPGMLLSRIADVDDDAEVSAEEWRDFTDSLEADSSGAIVLESLTDRLPAPPGGMGREGVDRGSRLSRMLDRDGDEVLEIDDLNDVFAELDQNGDGALTSEELPRFRHRHRRHGGSSVR